MSPKERSSVAAAEQPSRKRPSHHERDESSSARARVGFHPYHQLSLANLKSKGGRSSRPPLEISSSASQNGVPTKGRSTRRSNNIGGHETMHTRAHEEFYKPQYAFSSAVEGQADKTRSPTTSGKLASLPYPLNARVARVVSAPKQTSGHTSASGRGAKTHTVESYRKRRAEDELDTGGRPSHKSSNKRIRSSNEPDTSTEPGLLTVPNEGGQSWYRKALAKGKETHTKMRTKWILEVYQKRFEMPERLAKRKQERLNKRYLPEPIDTFGKWRGTAVTPEMRRKQDRERRRAAQVGV